MVNADGAQSGNEIAPARRAPGGADINSAGADLLRITRHAVGGGADVVAFDERSIGIDDAELGSIGEAFLAVAAVAGNDVALSCGRTADAVVAGEHAVLGGAAYLDPDEQRIADHDVALGRAVDVQTDESVAFSRGGAADDVAGGRRTADVAVDTDRGVQRPVDLAADHAIVVGDDLGGVTPLIDVAHSLDNAVVAVHEDGGRAPSVRLEAVDANFGAVGIGVSDICRLA